MKQNVLSPNNLLFVAKSGRCDAVFVPRDRPSFDISTISPLIAFKAEKSRLRNLFACIARPLFAAAATPPSVASLPQWVVASGVGF